MGRVLGLDVGARRIGVALSDTAQLLASPLLVYERTGMEADAKALSSLAHEHGCTAILFGLPLELDGTQGLRARRVEKLKATLAQHFTGEILSYDERFSTCEAERVLIGGRVRREKRKRVVDKVAAALILQAYLDSVGPGLL